MIYHINIVVSLISVYADHPNNSRKVYITTHESAITSAQKSKIWLITYNNTTPLQNNITNKTNTDINKTISDQYIIILRDNVTRTPKDLQDTLDNVTAKVQNEGARVIYVYKYSIKGLAIKVPSQQIAEKLINFLRNDPRILSIEMDKSMRAF